MRSILKVNWDSNLPIYAISQSELQKKELLSYFEVFVGRDEIENKK